MTEERKDSPASKPWQAKMSRRRFIAGASAAAGAAGLAGYLPDSVLRAAAASAPGRSSFDLSQVKHLVFMMQENRSFDHYFGAYPGVAGFSDPAAIKLPTGRSVFQQPDPNNPDGYLEPFHSSAITAAGAFIPQTNHSWEVEHASWNGGAMDGWLRAHISYDGPQQGPYVMRYHTQEDIPFHWALAEAFTLLDHYHCSVIGPSNPNHTVFGSGTIDPQGLGGGPVLDDFATAPLTFESGAETMFAAGITVKTYFGDSALWSTFANFKTPGLVPPPLYNSVKSTQSLFGNGTPGGLGDPANPTPASAPNTAFFEDCANGVLANVTFLHTRASEHPPGSAGATVSSLPAGGAQFMAQVLDALASNEDLWNTTVLVIQYDENDGFFDHVPPPTPDRAQFPEEFVTKASLGGTPGGGQVIGGGFRVPCWVISPWSTGGRIFSELNDHASCLRLVEAVAAAGGLSGRGPVRFPLISRWSRQTFGDLTGALTGAAQPAPASPEFDPATRAANLAAEQATATLPFPPIPGATQTMPVQLKKLP